MRWEYRTVLFETPSVLGGKLDAELFNAKLNELGREGWELASGFDTNMLHGRTREVVAVFKRQL